ncbi:MAG: sigma-54-dependent Fis family transcriptional regulator, partial [Candidatus Aminicenantes bacterium]|nr:sigma-54-dependent Fis family transcriptional regulator [Candidatus Aminicenantes bacterium]
SAIADTLLESELFGHVKGAFTDAVSETKGKFEIAGKGTLFLDEAGDLSPNLQSKLLRVIETRDFMKVGGEKVLKTEARIIAATNQDLKSLIEKGKFREDLYYRLKVVEITLPPLHERKEDVPDLVAYLLEKINRQLRKNVKKLPPGVMKVLKELHWKGNVRELENALTRAVILAKGDVILEENLPVDTGEKRIFPLELVSLKEVEKKYIQHVLNKTQGNKTKASQILQITRPTLDKKIKEYKLSV